MLYSQRGGFFLPVFITNILMKCVNIVILLKKSLLSAKIKYIIYIGIIYFKIFCFKWRIYRWNSILNPYTIVVLI